MLKNGFKYFIDYRYSNKIKPLCIFLQKMSSHRKDFDETKYVSFLFKEKVKNSFKKEFYSEPVYNEKCLKAKTNPVTEKSAQIFTIIKYQKKVFNLFIWLSVILIDSVFRTGKVSYPQVFLEECEHVIKEKKILKSIIDAIEIPIDSDADEENSDQEILKKIQM